METFYNALRTKFNFPKFRGRSSKRRRWRRNSGEVENCCCHRAAAAAAAASCCCNHSPHAGGFAVEPQEDSDVGGEGGRLNRSRKRLTRSISEYVISTSATFCLPLQATFDIQQQQEQQHSSGDDDRFSDSDNDRDQHGFEVSPLILRTIEIVKV